MTIAFLLSAAAVVLARFAIDYAARRRHWRLRRFSRLFGWPLLVGEGCLTCRTDYRYVLARPIVYEGETRETARVIIPQCVSCWNESGFHERLLAAGIVLREWVEDGFYDEQQELYDEHRTNVYAAVKANS